MDASKSSPSLLFNAASMADLLGPRAGSREGQGSKMGSKRSSKKIVGSKVAMTLAKI